MARPSKKKYNIKVLCETLNAYLDKRLEDKVLPNITRACLELGLCKQHLYRLAKKELERADLDDPNFLPEVHTPLSYSLKRFCDWQEVFLFEGALNKKLDNTTCIFGLKNLGWTDKPKNEESVNEIASALSLLGKVENALREKHTKNNE